MTTATTKAKPKAKRKVYKKKGDETPYAEVVAARIIDALEKGTAPWQNVLQPGRPGANAPTNPVTGKAYKGINSLILSMSGFSDKRWMTYKQATSLGGQVRAGQKGTTIQYWSFESSRVKRNEDGSAIKGEDGKSDKEHIRFNRPKLFTASVFNAEQIDGLEPYVEPEEPVTNWTAIERAEIIFERSGAQIDHVEGPKACYYPISDRIQMPERHQFPNAASYYSVKLHELGHWTGHKSRLNRDMTGGFGSPSYAKEELRAEIASYMVGDLMGIGHDPGDHFSYVASWIEALKNDPLEIFRASSDAEKIRRYIMDFENDLDADHDMDSEPDDAYEDMSPTP